MILDCPACGARYRLPDDAIPPDGKAVRCARCKHSWVELGQPLDEAVVPVAAVPPVMADAILPETYASILPAARSTPKAVAALEPVWEPDLPTPAPRRRRWLWLVPLLLLIALALGAAAVLTRVVALPRPLSSQLQLPAFTLPAVDLPPLDLPPLDLPPLDLTRIPYAGPWLDRRLNPPALPPVLLTLQADAGFHQLDNGSRMLALSGSVANPTGSQQAVPEIEAVVLDAARRPVYRWRIPAPLVALPPRSSAPFDSSASGYPAAGVAVTLRFVREP